MNWPRRLAFAMEWLWSLGGVSCLAAAAGAVLSEPLFRRAEKIPGRYFLIAAGSLPILLAAFKLGQFRAFELMWDSGVTVNLAWNMLHGWGVHSSVIGDASYLAVHFAFAYVWLSPLLLIWNSAGILALAQGALVGSTALAAYLIAKEIVADRFFACLLAVMVVSTPFFHDLVFCVLDNSVLAFPLFVWGLYAWLTGRRAAAIALAVMLITTREQIPFLIFGLGLYAWLSGRSRGGRRAAAALCAGSALLFIVEIALVRRAQAAWTDPVNYWQNFAFLGGAPGAVLHTALIRPWMLLAALVYPPVKLWTVAKVLLSFAALPLFAGAGLLPAAAVWLPNMLSDPGGFQDLRSHTCAYLFGPLLWAAALGAKDVLDRRLLTRRRLCALMLAAAGVGFLNSARFRHPERMNPAEWPESVPRAITSIPRGASVWCDEFFLPHLATRRYVKSLPLGGDAYFRPRLFAPDRVLVSAHWARLAKPAVAGPVLAFLRERGYVTLFAEKDVLLLANPATLGREGGAPEPVELPE